MAAAKVSNLVSNNIDLWAQYAKSRLLNNPGVESYASTHLAILKFQQLIKTGNYKTSEVNNVKELLENGLATGDSLARFLAGIAGLGLLPGYLPTELDKISAMSHIVSAASQTKNSSVHGQLFLGNVEFSKQNLDKALAWFAQAKQNSDSNDINNEIGLEVENIISIRNSGITLLQCGGDYKALGRLYLQAAADKGCLKSKQDLRILERRAAMNVANIAPKAGNVQQAGFAAKHRVEVKQGTRSSFAGQESNNIVRLKV